MLKLGQAGMNLMSATACTNVPGVKNNFPAQKASQEACPVKSHDLSRIRTGTRNSTYALGKYMRTYVSMFLDCYNKSQMAMPDSHDCRFS